MTQPVSQHTPATRAGVVSRLRSLLRVDQRLAGLHGALDAETMRSTLAGQALTDQITALSRQVDTLAGEVADIRAAVDALAARTSSDHERLSRQIDVVRRNEPRLRARLAEARQSTEYQLAYTEREPLISVIIPTFDRVETLRRRALPSVLAQTYANFEVVIVGDAAPPVVAETVAAFGDPRITFHNLTVRGPYPEDEDEAWYVKGVPPFSHGMRIAHGRWLCPFADDDALEPDALTTMLAFVREHQLEVGYGQILGHHWNGMEETIGAFPPSKGGQGFQGALIHRDLRMVEQDLGDSEFATPGDWGMMRTFMRIGARIGFLERVVAEWFQTPHPQHARHPVDQQGDPS